jgi:glycosyltransferase involved in cell wall biosynthesis
MSAQPQRGRVAIVCTHWAVHRTIVYMAQELARDGATVDLILYRAPTADLLPLPEGLPVRIFQLDSEADRAAPAGGGISSDRSLSMRVFAKAKRALYRVALKLAPQRVLFPRQAVGRMKALLQANAYDYVLAVEKGGLALISRCRPAKTPIVYLSLELYTADHPIVRGDPLMGALSRLERQFSGTVAVFVIQDVYRWNVLRADLQLAENARAVFFPIAEPQQEDRPKSDFLRERLSIPAHQKILLYFGVIRPERDSLELASVADRLPDGWVLVFHGPCRQATRERMLAHSHSGRIRFSESYIPSALRDSLVGSADIGLAIYGERTANDRLTGFASEKLALYLKAGVPVIARDNESYRHLWAVGAGRPVPSLEAIPEAVETMAKDLAACRNRARAAFDRYYSFEKNFARAKSEIAAALAHAE